MGWSLSPKPHLIVEGCLDAIATEHSAATKSPSHLWALSLLRIKGRRRALQAASVESKISMSPSVVRRLFFATFCVHRIFWCNRTKSIGCAHCSPWTDNAYASVVRRIRQIFTHLLYPFSRALPLPLGLLTRLHVLGQSNENCKGLPRFCRQKSISPQGISDAATTLPHCHPAPASEVAKELCGAVESGGGRERGREGEDDEIASIGMAKSRPLPRPTVRPNLN